MRQNGRKMEKKYVFLHPQKILHTWRKNRFFYFFRLLLSLFCPAPLYRPYCRGPVKWPKVGQNGSKIEKKTFFEIPEENAHTLIVSSIFFFILSNFSVNFQIFSKYFLSSSPLQALPPKPSKMAKSGSKHVQNSEKMGFYEPPGTSAYLKKIFFFGFF